MRLRAPRDGELVQVRALLAAAALPTADLDDAAVRFTVADCDDALVGVIGLQAFGASGLLRSLAVRADARGHGLGNALVGSLEAQARVSGLRELVLLTETAQAYFAARGYRLIDRQAAPAAVLASAEFRSLCPASAVCMLKPLDPA
ncbi:arsenic resistance N-acetyltransferase ArsN2 [Lysobacter silvisoli]|uniref:GNAT family N-acetyltransferase n=1 Tax=Lysobacter silvisoli TaxID=2293254 RepID=A0A371K4T4_9GAMM|nr:arsenic resistance N-acetyltransferase ArsN2 [Lysobacter silvisoli]RDZ28943.1 GNAT family N-acetyltransferase [Lysobacter silvisoli]